MRAGRGSVQGSGRRRVGLRARPRTGLAALALAGALLWVPAASATTAPALSEVAVSPGPKRLDISGRVAFPATTPTASWADGVGDAKQGGIGADASRATLARAGSDIVFGLEIADALADPVFTLPEVVHYHWRITVTAAGKTTPFMVQAMRSGQYNRPTPSPTPLLRVLSCGSLASGDPSCFTHLAEVPGTMAAGRIEWRVPAAVIGATSGARLGTFGAGLIVQPGASSATYSSGSLSTLDEVAVAPWFAGPQLAAVLVPEGADPDETQLQPISAAADGSFTTSLSTIGVFPGQYDVLIRACDGALCDQVRLPHKVTAGA